MVCIHAYLLAVFFTAFAGTLVCIMAHYSPEHLWNSVKPLAGLFIASLTCVQVLPRAYAHDKQNKEPLIKIKKNTP